MTEFENPQQTRSGIRRFGLTGSAIAGTVLLLAACGNSLGDQCGIVGEWIEFRYTDPSKAQVTWKRNGRTIGASYGASKPLKFSRNGSISGEESDGIPFGGGFFGRNWSCEAPNNVIVTAYPMGIQKRAKIYSSRLWKLNAAGYRRIFVKFSTPAEEKENLLIGIEAAVKAEGARFSRN